jgi:hypothetical protein
MHVEPHIYIDFLTSIIQFSNFFIMSFPFFSSVFQGVVEEEAEKRSKEE